MTPNFLKKILTAHYIWLKSKKDSGQKANLRNADLSFADLRNADLNHVNFQNADLSYADFQYADLSDANLYKANLNHANLSDANLSGADLSNANLEGANLTNANLSGADLRNANLENTKELLNPTEWMDSNFEKNNKGYIVFKRIGKNKTQYFPPDHWVIKEDFYLTEIVDKDRLNSCSYGVNFGTREWCKNNFTRADLWECLLEFDDLDELVVPYSSDGKARCGRLKLVKIT